MEIPSYSLTGDILSYLRCGLQYRYYKIGKLPPSKPIQLWFGEFIHAVMNEAYRQWKDRPERDISEDISKDISKWSWKEHIRPIEIEVYRRLKERKLLPPTGLFCPYYEKDGQKCVHKSKELCPKASPAICWDREDHKLLASCRAEAAIKVWGPHLFPLISEAEVKLQGLRKMKRMGQDPAGAQDSERASLYEVTGIADVIGKFDENDENELIKLIKESIGPERLKELREGKAEIIVDYKGTTRPTESQPEKKYYEYQLKTYGWLRSQRPDAVKVIAGIILYIDELAPSKDNIEALLKSAESGTAGDFLPDEDVKKIMHKWCEEKQPLEPGERNIVLEFLKRRSIEITHFDEIDIDFFDEVAFEIKYSIDKETKDGNIFEAWQKRVSGENKKYLVEEEEDNRTCVTCDFKGICPIYKNKGSSSS